MFGYLLIAMSVSAFGGLLFFLILGKPTGVGISALIILLVGGVMWQIKRNKKKK
jgi:hypothetical protein